MDQERKQAVRDLAEKYPDMHLDLKKSFPEAFEPEYYQFGKEHTITIEVTDSPLFIYTGGGKTLLVNSIYEAELIEELTGAQFIRFRKK